MRVLREVFFFAVSFMIISLAACDTNAVPTQTTGMPTPAGTGASGELPASPTEAPHLTLLAQDWLAGELGVPAESVVLENVEPAEWTDSCLGLGGPAESCLAAMTPGWRMQFSVNGQPYEVRSDQSGQALRLATESAAPAPDQPTAGSPGTQNPAGGMLEGTQWVLVSMGPADGQLGVADGSPVTLAFQAGGQAGGNSGCNSYGGGYTETGYRIAFANIVSTMMACTDQAIMDREQQYLGALQGAERFERIGDQLQIFYNNDQGVLTFTASQ